MGSRVSKRAVRQFRTQLFMGNGDISERRCRLLHKRLDYGLMLMSGLQQGGALRGTTEYKAACKEIREVVWDVATALGVKIDGRLTELPYEQEQ